MRWLGRVFGVGLLLAVLGAGGAALGAVNDLTAIPYEYRVR